MKVTYNRFLTFFAIGLVLWASTGVSSAAPFDQSKIDAGLVVWQTQLDTRGRACVDCHGAPDAFDLAYFNFSDADIRRRGTPNHIGTVDTEKIVDLVHELRKKYDITSPKDPLTTRVFQPGGAPLPGATATERDAAFVQTLQTKLPMLATGTVDTPAKADTAAGELLAYDMRVEPNGILFPRWSEDIFFGIDHGRITDWIADEGFIPFSSTSRSAINFARATYVASPTEANFWTMYQAITSNSDVKSSVIDNNQRALWGDKYLNSVIGSHDLRMTQLGLPRIMDKANTRHTQISGTSFVFPTWMIGDNVNTVGTFSSEIRSSLDTSISDENHVAAGKDAWWWVGFMYNNSFEHEPERQEYFPNSLAENIGPRRVDQGSGYFVGHSLFARAKSDISAALLPNPTVPGDQPYYGNIPRTNPLAAFNAAPAFGLSFPVNPDTESYRWFNATHKAQYIKMALNISKMRLYLWKKHLDASIAAGATVGPLHVDDNMGAGDFVDYRNVILQFTKWDAANLTADTQLFNTVVSLRDQARRGNRVPFVGTGDGLNGTYFNSLNFTNQVATRVDPKVDFDNGPQYFGGANGAIYPTGDNQLSVRWTGYYKPKFTDTYTFWAFMSGDLDDIPIQYGQPNQGASRIWVNNVLVFDMTQPNVSNNVNQGMNPNPNLSFPSVNLEAGRSYPITVEYAQTGAYQRMVLLERSWLQPLNAIPQSQLYTALQPDGVPSAPNNLTLTNLTSSTIRVAWTDYSYNETGFTIQRKTGSGGTYADVGTVGANLITFDNTGLSSSTTYYYRVKATNSQGSSAYSTEASISSSAGPKVANLLLYEGFDYPSGSNLVGKNAGKGWASGSSWATDGTASVVGALGFSDYAVTGLAGGITTSYKNISRNIAVSQNSGADVWMSYLFRDASWNDYGDSDSIGFTDANGAKLQTAPALSGANASAAVDSTWGAAGAAKLSNGTTYLIIAKFTRVGTGTSGNPQVATLWAINSSQYDAIKAGGITETELDSNNTAKATDSYGGVKNLASGNGFYFFNGRSGQGFIDEIKLATTLARLFDTQ